MAEQKDIQLYSREWYAKMVQIWRDRIALMGIRDTGALASSIAGAGLQLDEMQMQADFRFLEYGLAVDTGRESTTTTPTATNSANSLSSPPPTASPTTWAKSASPAPGSPPRGPFRAAYLPTAMRWYSGRSLWDCSTRWRNSRTTMALPKTH